MPNGLRHLIGVIIGLAALPLVLYLLAMQVKFIDRAAEYASPDELRWAGLCIVGAGVVSGVLACWRRLSPLAALIPGLGLAAAGGLGFFMQIDFKPMPLAELINWRTMPVSLALGIALIASTAVPGGRRRRVVEG
jgi:hypothetical protein